MVSQTSLDMVQLSGSNVEIAMASVHHYGSGV
jgi:hypothetical protein